MSGKRNLFEELNIEKKEQDLSGPLDVDVQTIRRNVSEKLDAESSEYPACPIQNERKSVTMKLNAIKSNTRSKKKISVIAAVAVLALGTTVFAASGIISNWYSSSSDPEYKSLPTAQQVKKDIGYDAVLISEFENGYAFKDGSIVNNNLADEDGNSVEKFKSVSFDYEKNGDTVIFSQDKFNSKIDMDGNVIKTADGADIYYYSYTNKIVPADYKMTDEDKKAEADGELVFTYGSSDVRISEVQSVTWVKDNIQYQLMQMDGALSQDELAEMAEEVISK